VTTPIQTSTLFLYFFDTFYTTPPNTQNNERLESTPPIQMVSAILHFCYTFYTVLQNTQNTQNTQGNLEAKGYLLISN